MPPAIVLSVEAWRAAGISPMTSNKEILTLYEKRQSTDANHEMIQMLQLSNKYYKVAVIKLLPVCYKQD